MSQLALLENSNQTDCTISSKRRFLSNLRSPSPRHKYKRYIGSPIRYAGGKSLAVGRIIEMIPDDVSCVVSPFIGGGSVEVALARECGIYVKGYDVFDILTNYWQEQISAPKNLAAKLANWAPNKEQYKKVKDRLRKHWKKEKFITNPRSLAAHYWFNHNLSYGPGFLGWMSQIYENSVRYKGLVQRVRNFYAPQLEVEQGDFQSVIGRHTNDFLYCDPPYYLEGDSKMFRGIYPQRNFPVHHKGFSHENLRDLLRAHQGQFVLSYNDCSTIRKWYKDYKIIKVSWQYTLGQGETRIGLNRINDGRDHVKNSHEILIVNI